MCLLWNVFAAVTSPRPMSTERMIFPLDFQNVEGVLLFCRLVRGTEPHGYCRSHNHTATCSAMLQSIMPSARLARYRQRRYAKHCSAASVSEALQGGANSRSKPRRLCTLGISPFSLLSARVRTMLAPSFFSHPVLS